MLRNFATVALYLLSFAVAGYALFAYSIAPLGSLVHPDMAFTFQNHSTAIYAHIFGSAIALLLGPLQFQVRLRAKYPRLHRWSGRLYLGVGVLIGGSAGLYMANFAFGNMLAKTGFACLALAWLYTGTKAYIAIKKRDIKTHQRWMIRNFALTLAAVTLRLYLPAALVTGITFSAAYPIIAWLCWLPNLLVAERIINRVAK